MPVPVRVLMTRRNAVDHRLATATLLTVARPSSCVTTTLFRQAGRVGPWLASQTLCYPPVLFAGISWFPSFQQEWPHGCSYRPILLNPRATSPMRSFVLMPQAVSPFGTRAPSGSSDFRKRKPWESHSTSSSLTDFDGAMGQLHESSAKREDAIWCQRRAQGPSAAQGQLE